MKSCDGCALCCKVMAVTEIQKPKDIWCSQIDRHSGGRECKVYAERPNACRSFSCLWLLSQSRPGQEMPDELRPDRCHVVLAPDFMVQNRLAKGENLLYAFVEPTRPEAWRTGHLMRETIKNFLRRGGWVIVHIGNKRAILKDGQPPIIGYPDEAPVAAAAARALLETVSPATINAGLPAPILDPAEFARSR